MSELPPRTPPLADVDPAIRAVLDASDMALETTLDDMLENALNGPQIPPEKAQFLASLPKLNSRRNARVYISRVAIGFQLQLLTGAEARVMLYMAQLALSAAPPPTPRPSRAGKTPPRKVGFTA